MQFDCSVPKALIMADFLSDNLHDTIWHVPMWQTTHPAVHVKANMKNVAVWLSCGNFPCSPEVVINRTAAVSSTLLFCATWCWLYLHLKSFPFLEMFCTHMPYMSCNVAIQELHANELHKITFWLYVDVLSSGILKFSADRVSVFWQWKTSELNFNEALVVPCITNSFNLYFSCLFTCSGSLLPSVWELYVQLEHAAA